jgi:hypothetical protein
MDSLKDIIMTYIKVEYDRTKWPYFTKAQLLNMFGNIEAEIRELIDEMQIYLREGVNGDLIVYRQGEELTEKLKINNSINSKKHGKRNKRPIQKSQH